MGFDNAKHAIEMKVGVFLEDFSPDVGGGYTIQEDIFRAMSGGAVGSRIKDRDEDVSDETHEKRI